jgi:hypothetical protein
MISVEPFFETPPWGNIDNIHRIKTVGGCRWEKSQAPHLGNVSRKSSFWTNEKPKRLDV